MPKASNNQWEWPPRWLQGPLDRWAKASPLNALVLCLVLMALALWSALSPGTFMSPARSRTGIEILGIAGVVLFGGGTVFFAVVAVKQRRRS